MRIRLSENFRAVFYAPFYATHALGFYASEGVDVELLSSPEPGAAVSGLLDASIDVSWGGPMRVMKARDLDPHSPLMCFCEVAARDPFFLIGKAADFALEDLLRLRVATVAEVPTPWLCLQHDLREQGIDPVKLNRVADRTMGENLEALRRNEIDVVQVFEPYVSQALQTGVADILYAASARGPTSYTTFLATRESIRRNRPALAAMVRATRRTLTWLAEHGADELSEAVALFYSGTPPDILASSLARYRDAELWARTPEVSRQGFARLAESLQSGGFIARMPSYEGYVDQSFSVL